MKEESVTEKKRVFRTDVEAGKFQSCLDGYEVQTSPEARVPARAFFLGFFDIIGGCNNINIKTWIDESEARFPTYLSPYSDLWAPSYKVNNVSMADEKLREIYKDIDWSIVETIKTDKYEKANGDSIVEAHPLEIEYMMVELNQYGSSAGILAKHARLIASLSNSVLETGTGFGVFSRAFLAGRPKWFVTCDTKKWFDAPAKLKQICRQNNIQFEFFHGRSLDLKMTTRVDTVFLDGDHSYDYVSEELEMFGDNLHQIAKKFIVLHDANLPSVVKAVTEFLKNNPQWRECFYDIRAEGFLVLARESQFVDETRNKIIFT